MVAKEGRVGPLSVAEEQLQGPLVLVTGLKEQHQLRILEGSTQNSLALHHTHVAVRHAEEWLHQAVVGLS